MTRKIVWIVPVALFACLEAAGQPAGANYDESKVPNYTLPDVLTLKNGQKVRTAKDWSNKRRPEILELYRSEVFGRSPSKTPKLNYELFSIDHTALGGKAMRKQVTVFFTDKADGPRMNILMYLPAAATKAVPVFLGLGFTGNQGVMADPGIRLADEWVRDPATRQMVKRPAGEQSRGAAAGRWQVEKILEHGYGLVTIYYGDIEPDFDGGRQYGIRPLFAKPGQTEPAPDDWGSIGAWAWGLSRAMDYLEKDHDVDARRVAVIGHSRLGKTALWAGAQDTRFSLVISNDSGEGGAAISRRQFGEQVRNLNTSFPYWFCANFKKYNDREDELPVDSHMLIALIAPRPVYVASAAGRSVGRPAGRIPGPRECGAGLRTVRQTGTRHRPDAGNSPAHHARPRPTTSARASTTSRPMTGSST